MCGELPEGIHGHYGPELIAYILNDYYACRVTEPLLLDKLHQHGVLISSGQLNNILIEGKDSFREEKDEMLAAGIAAHNQIQTDDCGARHKGKNQYTNVIGNEWFSVFSTTDSKSRANFFRLLQSGRHEYLPAIPAGIFGNPESLGKPDNSDSPGNGTSAVWIEAGTNEAVLEAESTNDVTVNLSKSEGSDPAGIAEYLLNEDAITYLQDLDAPTYLPGYTSFSIGKKFTSLEAWQAFLMDRNITKKTEIRLVTEAALFASIIQNGIPRDLGVHGDDAGQFDAFIRSLCWIHEERHYRKIIPTDEQTRSDLDQVRDRIWTIYRDLKAYQQSPNDKDKKSIEKQFNDLFLNLKTSSV